VWTVHAGLLCDQRALPQRPVSRRAEAALDVLQRVGECEQRFRSPSPEVRVVSVSQHPGSVSGAFPNPHAGWVLVRCQRFEPKRVQRPERAESRLAGPTTIDEGGAAPLERRRSAPRPTSLWRQDPPPAADASVTLSTAAIATATPASNTCWRAAGITVSGATATATSGAATMTRKNSPQPSRGGTTHETHAPEETRTGR
jgi:hypothetical protein